MQPFDQGVFDKRYDDVLEPAIRSAGLEPYRVDRDPSVSIPIEDIESGIRDSDVCLAEITLDNPNVWYELGFAIACGKEVVLVCSSERTTRFPFDIQHRHIVTYRPESPRDFERLGSAVTDRLKAALRKERQIARLVGNPVMETHGLESHEIAALVFVMQYDFDDPPSVSAIKHDMDRAGYKEIATVLGLTRLKEKGLVEEVVCQDYHGDDYLAFRVTPQGRNWLLQNQERLVLRNPKEVRRSPEDELPF